MPNPVTFEACSQKVCSLRPVLCRGALVLLAAVLASGCTRGPTPESACQELQRARLVSGCAAGTTVNTENLPGTQWHFKLEGATVDNEGVLIQFNDANEADAAYEKVKGTDALMHSVQTGFDQVNGREQASVVHPSLPWRFAVNKPWTLIMMPAKDGDGSDVVNTLKAIYLKDGAQMTNLFYSGTTAMAVPVK